MYFRKDHSRCRLRRLLPNSHLLFCFFLALTFFSGCSPAIQQREADRFIIKAQFHHQNFRHREALQYYQKAWQTYETVDNPPIQAALLYNIGNLYYDLQEYENALKYYRLSLEFSQFIEKEHQIKIFNNIGVIYRYLGRYKEALGYFEKALESLGQAKTAKVFDLGKEHIIIHLNRAVTFVKLGNPQKALDILQELPTSHDTKKYKYEIALTQSIRGIIEAKYFDKIPEAFDSYEQALAVFKELDQHYDLAFSYHNLGLLYTWQKEYQKAIEYFTESLELSEKIGDQETTWLAYYNLGNVYEKRSDFIQAIQNYRDSIRVIESIRSKLKIDDFKTSFIEDKIQVYKALIHLLSERGEEEEAFNYLERAKSRALVDLLSNQKIQAREGIDERLIQEKEQADDRIRSLSKKLDKEYSKPGGKRKEAPRLIRELQQARQYYEHLLQEIQAENLEYASLIHVNPLTLREIQNLNLIPNQTAFLEYLILEDKILIFILTRENFHLEKVEVSQRRLQGTVFAFRIDIEKEMPGWQEKARWLYSKLIYPAEPYLWEIDTLCIVPYGILHYLPFGALIVNDGKEVPPESESPPQILLKKYNLFYTPSSTVLQFAMKKRKSTQDRVLMFANPDQSLAYAEKEAEGIQKHYPQAKLFAKSAATEGKVKELGGNYHLIHFATHGILDPVQPLFSALVLADGFLEVHEIFNEIALDNSNLVTLSACNTALGKRTEGDEIIGLTRALMYAGVPSIVASLWAVDDQSTALLMERFYQNLKQEGKVKAKALKHSQISLFEDPKHQIFHHPYYWAAFELIGDYR